MKQPGGPVLVAWLVALAVTGCTGDDDAPQVACSEIEVGDPIEDPADAGGPSCSRPGEGPDNAVMTFDCADGRLHVRFTDEHDRMLEGFVGAGETWRLAAWNPDAGRTQLQIDCGG